MAEVLGLVASGVAVTQLVSAILTSGIKIKQLFDEVKDVPETIIYLMDNIDTLASVLLAAGDEHREATSRNSIQPCSNDSVQKSLQICQKALDHMISLSKDLEGKIQSSHPLKKRIGRVKVVLKNSVLVKYERRLDLSLQLLSLSQQAYMIGLQRAQPDIIVSRLAALIRSELTTPQLGQSDGNNRHVVMSESMMPRTWLANTTSNLQCVDSDLSKIIITPTRTTPTNTKTSSRSSANYFSSWQYPNRKPTFTLGYASLTGLIEIDTLQDPMVLHVLGDTQGKNPLAVTSSSSCKAAPRFQGRLHIPRWLSHKVWECAALQSTWGWTYHFRTYNIIDERKFPYLVDGISHIYQRNLENLQNALKNGQISIYDKFYCGFFGELSLLHCYAIVEPQLCLFLVNQGADIDIVDSFGIKPVAYISTFKHRSTTSTSHIQIFQQLLPSAELDENNKINLLSDFESRESWLYIQKKIWADYYQPSNAGARLEVVGNMVWGASRRSGPEVIKLALFGDGVPAPCGLNSLEAHEISRTLSNILSHLASIFGSWRARPNETRANKILEDIEALQDLVRNIIVTYGFYHHSHLAGLYQGGDLKEQQLIALISGYYYFSKTYFSKTPTFKEIWSKVWDEAILPWLKFLEACGIDLVEYGQYQKSELRQDVSGRNFREGNISLFRPGELDYAHLLSFKYGPSPLDWHFWWGEPTDCFAGTFWRLVERQMSEDLELSMPGAWVA